MVLHVGQTPYPCYLNYNIKNATNANKVAAKRSYGFKTYFKIRGVDIEWIEVKKYHSICEIKSKNANRLQNVLTAPKCSFKDAGS